MPDLQDTIQNPLTKNRQEKNSTIPIDCTALAVEDDASNFVQIARLLSYLGIHCEWKTSGYELVEYTNTLPRLDLILINTDLPYEDVFDLLKFIRPSDRLKIVPIVGVATEASIELLQKAQNAGFAGFLVKPLDPDLFPDQIRKILAGESVWETG